jgi:chromatin-remodeling ATPase INO80
MAQTNLRRGIARINKVGAKDAQARARKLTKDMLRSERTEGATRRKEEKLRAEQGRIEEERREANRQKRKLEFLMRQTELYGHFIGSKLKSKSSIYPFKKAVFVV